MLSAVRRILICAAAAALVTIALRSALGPFPLWPAGLRVNSPFPAESVFWLAVLALLSLARNTAVRPCAVTGAALRFPAVPLFLVIALVSIAFSRNLNDPFLSDDYILVGRASLNAKVFLASLHTPGGDGAFRPLGYLYFDLAKAVAGHTPAAWHLISLTIHLLNTALVFFIAWKMWQDRTIAAASALVFGLHGTRPEVVVWTAGSFDLLACACVLASIAIALADADRGRTWRLIVGVLLIACGILCKESAYAAPVVALWILCACGRLQWSRVYLAGSAGVCAMLFAYRWYLFHGPGGYTDPATGRPAILSLNVLSAFNGALVRIWAILVAPVNWRAPMSWWEPLAIAAGMSGLLMLTSSAKPGLSPALRLCAVAATSCAVLPAIHLTLIDRSGLGSRILYLPSVLFALLVGGLALSVMNRRLALLTFLLLGMARVLENNLSAWHRVALHARDLCAAAARQPKPRRDAPVSATLEGVFLFKSGLPECISAERAAGAVPQ